MKVRWVGVEWNYETDFLFYSERLDGDGHQVVTRIENGNADMVIVPRGALIPGPTLKLHHHEAQELIQSFLDEAWDKGFRPTKEKQTREQIEKEIDRLEDHLDDMRALVFGVPPIEMRTYLEEKIGVQAKAKTIYGSKNV